MGEGRGQWEPELACVPHTTPKCPRHAPLPQPLQGPRLCGLLLPVCLVSPPRASGLRGGEKSGVGELWFGGPAGEMCHL